MKATTTPTIHFSTNLKAYRRLHGLTQTDVANMLSIPRPRYAKWEEKGCTPDYTTLVMLSRIMGMSIDRLLTEDISTPSHI